MTDRQFACRVPAATDVAPDDSPRRGLNRTVLVTGATGYIGRHLIARLAGTDTRIHALARRPADGRWSDREVVTICADLTRPDSLSQVCRGADTVFHLAGYAHAANGDIGEADDLHWRVTVDGTRALLDDALKSGVRRFVFVSSVKAMGEGGPDCLDENSPAKALSGYGRAKLEAESMLLRAAEQGQIEYCVLRLPLVYGRDNKGNIPRMIAAVDRGRFPPLPEVGNRRSMVHVDDVVQALLLAGSSPEAAGQIYIVTDGRTYSTREIYQLIRAALGRGAPKWAVPLAVLRIGAILGDIGGRLLRRPLPLNTEVLDKLTGSACYRSDKIADQLGFHPTRTLEDAMAEMVASYKGEAG